MAWWALTVLGGCGWLSGSKGEVPEVRDGEIVAPGDERGGRRGGRRGDRERSGGGAGGGAGGMDLVKIQVDGRERSAFVHAPSGAAGEKLPLILMFHGGHADGTAAARLWVDQMDGDYVLAFPNGQTETELSGWTPTNGDIKEHVRFVDALIDDLAAKYPVDKDRVFAAGFSDGAQMTFRLACMLDDHFAGFAIVAQTMKEDTLDACKPSTAKPILYITGTADRKNPANGRESEKEDGVARIGIEDTLDFWLDNNKCNKRSEKDRDLADLPGDETRVKERLFEDCKGAPIRFLVVEGGGHSWPTPIKKGGDHCSDISASDEALSWWRQHARFGG